MLTQRREGVAAARFVLPCHLASRSCPRARAPALVHAETHSPAPAEDRRFANSRLREDTARPLRAVYSKTYRTGNRRCV